jgi:heme/copper-type cytochrome/quinol oxidase subunit 4
MLNGCKQCPFTDYVNRRRCSRTCRHSVAYRVGYALGFVLFWALILVPFAFVVYEFLPS